MILFIFLSGKPPFPGREGRDVFAKIRKGKYDMEGEEWGKVSAEAKDLVNQMLIKNQILRPSANELLRHPWFKNSQRLGNIDPSTNFSIMSRLMTFKSTDPFRRVALNYIASQLTTVQETENLRRRFIEMDANNDGKLSKEEILAGFRSMGLGANIDIEEIFRICDTDKSGYVDYTEFITMTMNWKNSLSESQIKTAFAAFDREKKGAIMLDDIKHLFVNENTSETDLAVWQEMLEEVDENGDGVIDLSEFEHMIRQCTVIPKAFQPKLRRSMP